MAESKRQIYLFSRDLLKYKTTEERIFRTPHLTLSPLNSTQINEMDTEATDELECDQISTSFCHYKLTMLISWTSLDEFKKSWGLPLWSGGYDFAGMQVWSLFGELRTKKPKHKTEGTL